MRSNAVVAKRDWRWPDSGLEFLSTSFNPRPAGIVLQTISPHSEIGEWPPSNKLSDLMWSTEMKHNSGSYIAIVLRLKAVTQHADFMALFESFDRSYRAVKRRAQWASVVASSRKRDEYVVNKIMAGTREALAQLEGDFVEWATRHRAVIAAALATITSPDARSVWNSGNAITDLDREQPDWWLDLQSKGR